MGLGKRMEDRRRWLNGERMREMRGGGVQSDREEDWFQFECWNESQRRRGKGLGWCKSPASFLLSSSGLLRLREAVSSRPRLPGRNYTHPDFMAHDIFCSISKGKREIPGERKQKKSKIKLTWVWAKMLMRAKWGNRSFFLVPTTQGGEPCNLRLLLYFMQWSKKDLHIRQTWPKKRKGVIVYHLRLRSISGAASVVGLCN